MKLRSALLAATAIAALPALAHAQVVDGIYVSLGGGYNLATGADVEAKPTGGATQTGTVTFDGGFAGLAAIGYGFGNGFRVELEGNFRGNKVDSISQSIGGKATSGSQYTYGAMVNALYDFDFGIGVLPYIGGGVGYAFTDWDGVRGSTTNSGGTQLRVDDDDGQFAYQGIVGLALPLYDLLPGLSVTGEYRYFATLDPELDGSRRAPGGASTPATIDAENANHTFLVGLRYAFNVPTPPPVAPAPVAAPVQAPAPARTYLVFFDWDRADLTDRARQIIGESAEASRRVAVTRIEVSGHTDTSGSPAYNQRLSIRRAEAVANELARLGIPRNQMSIQGFGQTRLLVPTADNVREPQNRRVEIVLR